ncbi:hypothetical protein CDAR_408801 [Caerostris darwini]|uniref:Uncharacterized protein n=1 Tax=Caerostris darwini TaxID=1538125 RepID=A0AAV4MEV4_9ARAC|nr:hypothetical protein CDAR_408801 [Caerostris darwini]
MEKYLKIPRIVSYSATAIFSINSIYTLPAAFAYFEYFPQNHATANRKINLTATAFRRRNKGKRFTARKRQNEFCPATVTDGIRQLVTLFELLLPCVPGQFIPLVAKMKYFNIDKRHARRLSDRPSGSDTFSLFAVFYCHLASGIPSSECSPTANSFRNSRKLKFLSPLESFLVVSFCDYLFWNRSLY